MKNIKRTSAIAYGRLSMIGRLGMICLCLFAACKKQDHYYKEFIDNGEIVYVGKADSVVTHSGNNRILLHWKINDPNMTQMKVYWNEGADSAVLQGDQVSHPDSIGLIIDHLEERLYRFELVSLDGRGNRSIRVAAEGQVYGEQYQSTLLNRLLSQVVYQNQEATISWQSAEQGMVRTELYYQDTGGKEKVVHVPKDVNSLTLSQVPPMATITYRTAFIPDSLAIDTFFTTYETIQIK